MIDFENIFIEDTYTDFDAVDDESDITQDIKSTLDEMGYDWDEGSSKLVIIDQQVVYKIPYYSYEGYVNKNAGGEDGSDYCDSERVNYESAFAAGLEDFFAEINFEKVVNGYPIYSQPRVKTYRQKYSDSYLTDWAGSEEGKDTISRMRDSYDDCNVTDLPYKWLSDATAVYGEARVKQLLDFLDTEGINDCCWRNIGYRLDNDEPVIFDFSGYYED